MRRKKTILLLAIFCGFMVLSGLSCIGYDAWAAQESGATISEVIKDAWEAVPWVFLLLFTVASLITGFLMGHFFGSQSPRIARGLTKEELVQAIEDWQFSRQWSLRNGRGMIDRRRFQK